MRTRDAVLDYRKTMADAATYEKDLDLQDPISALYIEVEATNGSSYNRDNWISDIVTKVEVVDGSEVLASLNMFELEALYFYKTGKTPTIQATEIGGYPTWHGCYLLFGRYLWDQVFALDPAVFKNPQLKITFNKAAVRAASDTTAFITGDNIKLTVVAKVMENMIGRPGKYLMPKSINRWTSTSGDRRIELPADYVYRLMLLRAYLKGSALYDVISDVKLTCDTDKYVPFNRKMLQLEREAGALFGEHAIYHEFVRAHGASPRTMTGDNPHITIIESASTGAVFCRINYTSPSSFYLSLFKHDGTNWTEETTQLIAKESGCALHATLPIPFGIMGDESTWFNPRDYGKIEAVVTEVTGAPCGILLEQVRPNMKVG